MLATLTKLTYTKWVFEWTQVEQDAFEKIKRIVSRDTLPSYPDRIETIKVHTEAITFRLGAFISQKDKPIALYSRKVTDSQQQYTVTDKVFIISINS